MAVTVTVIDGFKISSGKGREKKIFAPPQVPRDFRLTHKWEPPKTAVPTVGESGLKSGPGHFSRQTAGSRAQVLGETPQVSKYILTVLKL